MFPLSYQVSTSYARKLLLFNFQGASHRLAVSLSIILHPFPFVNTFFEKIFLLTICQNIDNLNARKREKAPIKNQSPEDKSSGLSGAANQIRTDDLILTKDVLYQLSYSSNSLIVISLIIIAKHISFVKRFFRKKTVILYCSVYYRQKSAFHQDFLAFSQIKSTLISAGLTPLIRDA